MYTGDSYPERKIVAPTLEYTCSVCTCGRELSTLFYRLVAQRSFTIFAEKTELTGVLKHMDFLGDASEHINTSVLDKQDIGFCCRLSLMYGIRAPISTMSDISDGQSSKKNEHGENITYKYPSGLPGPLSKEKILTWF